MQKQLEVMQNNSSQQQASPVNQAVLNDRSNDQLYKSIDPNQGLEQQLPQKKDGQYKKTTMSQQQAMILERKQSVSTMRFCSFDQDNNVN